jgi:hypothetical protein
LPPGIWQVEPRPFPSRDHRPIAQVALGPLELASRFGIRFREKSWEDLGPFRFAALDLAGGDQVWLVQHLEGTPHVYVDFLADFALVAIELMNALGLTEAEMPWRLTMDLPTPNESSQAD